MLITSDSNQISIMEVGPRDGLQNVSDILTLNQKIALIQYLMDRGFTHIEAGSFVRADKIPAMANTDQIADHFVSSHDKLWYLVPNLKGLQLALEHKATQLAFFTASSQTFNKKNIGMTIQESCETIHECIEYLRDKNYHIINQWSQKPTDKNHLKLRLYISMVISCPYEGSIKPQQTIDIMDELMHLGFSQVSLGDTIGVGTPQDWKLLLQEIGPSMIKNNQIAMHCHNTYGKALTCVGEGLELGIRSFDSSIGGLGGCPFAKGAPGNLATEDLIDFLEKQGIRTGIGLHSLHDAFHSERTGTLKNNSLVFKKFLNSSGK